MVDFVGHSGQLFAWLGVLVVLVAGGAYAIGKIRAKTVQQEPNASELLSKFRELHSQGVLSDAEFRTIKTTLTVRLRKELGELNNNGERGSAPHAKQ
ncbi:MAG: hypothetical protein ABSG68_11545 [Thermoguttaceae bacterium]|jgi:hypothetical protein